MSDTIDLEALETLAFARGAWIPRPDELTAAANALLAELVSVAEAAGCHVDVREDHVRVALHEEIVRVGHERGRVFVRDLKATNLGFVESLAYDPLQKRFVGALLDERHVPRPGEPKRRVAAVAVLARAVVAAWKVQRISRHAE
jgi:hypothetical protein